MPLQRHTASVVRGALLRWRHLKRSQTDGCRAIWPSPAIPALKAAADGTVLGRRLCEKFVLNSVSKNFAMADLLKKKRQNPYSSGPLADQTSCGAQVRGECVRR